jgi:hypothetical protein
MEGDSTSPSEVMTKETWALPKNSLCSLTGSFGGTIDTAESPEEQTGTGSVEEHAPRARPSIRAVKMRIILKAGLTPELSRAAKRLRLE